MPAATGADRTGKIQRSRPSASPQGTGTKPLLEAMTTKDMGC